MTIGTNIRARTLLAALSLGVLGALLFAERANAAAPPNDMFTNAELLAGDSGTFAGSTADATTEPGEPAHAGQGQASVWFRWTAPSTGAVVFDTFGSTFDTVLAVYTGSAVDALSLVASNDDAGSFESEVAFSAQAGTSYAIAVAGYFFSNGPYTLNWAPPTEPTVPPNDDLVDAIAIAGAQGTLTGSNVLATTEAGEPLHAGVGSTSVWYRWTAPTTGSFRFDTFFPPDVRTRFDTTLAVYTGERVNALTLAVANDDAGVGGLSALTVPAVRGVKYALSVGGSGGATGDFRLTWREVEEPANDNFANALRINGLEGTTDQTNANATVEPGEPAHAGGPGGASVWFRWTATKSGRIGFDTYGSRFLDTQLAVYTGNSLRSLIEVASNDDAPGILLPHSRLQFDAVAGTTYRIAVDGYQGQTDFVRLTWRQPPANDDFADALPISGSIGRITGDSRVASSEPGEPTHAGFLGASIWYQWVAPGSGRTLIDTSGSAFDTVLSVYTGRSLDTLELVAEADQIPLPQALVTFDAVAGRKYWIAVDGYRPAGEMASAGPVQLTWKNRPANDDFAAAQQLPGTRGLGLEGHTVFSTAEPGEPNHGGGGSSVWYRWTAPYHGRVGFNTVGSQAATEAFNGSSAVYDTVLAVYTGGALDSLQLVAQNDNLPFSRNSTDSWVEFVAERGRTYFIAVDGRNGQVGHVRLNWFLAPPNDDFLYAERISGRTGRVTGTNDAATGEPGEPESGASARTTVWYRWTPPSNGVATFEISDPRSQMMVDAYTGTTVDALTRASYPDAQPLVPQPKIQFPVRAGTTYSISVDGVVEPDGSTGPFELRWRMSELP
jgi:hypothetical protein